MPIALRFWKHMALWGLGFLILLVAMGLMSGDPRMSNFLFHIPDWAAVLVLPAFPAGIAVASLVALPGSGLIRRVLELTGAAAVVSVVLYLFVAVVVPWAAPTQDLANLATVEARALNHGELHETIAAAKTLAENDPAGPSLQRWQPVNILIWEHERRIVESLLPLVFAWLGALVGFWARWSARPEIRQAQYWAVGFFNLVALWGASENGFEFIVIRAAGLADYAAWLAGVVPSMLVLGMAGPTLIALWKGIPDFDN